jgi:4-hydroxy-tetrahydrodipicolinate synthase
MFQGVFTPVITTFDEKGNIDFGGMERMIEHLIAGGMNGLLFLGSIGEFFALTKDEKKELISFAVKKVNRRIPVMIGTGGTVVDEVVELTRFAESEGADAAVVISPYYFSLGEEDLYRYYKQVAESVAMPILLYNFPDRTCVNMSPKLITKLAVDFRNIVGIKDTVDNISHTRQIIHEAKKRKPQFAVLSGFDEYFIPNMMAGGDGVICGLTNVVPELFSTLLKDYRNRNMEGVETAQYRISLLMNIYAVSQPFVGAIKGAAEIRGVKIRPFVKSPSAAIDDEQRTRIKALLDEAGISSL